MTQPAHTCQIIELRKLLDCFYNLNNEDYIVNIFWEDLCDPLNFFNNILCEALFSIEYSSWFFFYPIVVVCLKLQVKFVSVFKYCL